MGRETIYPNPSNGKRRIGGKGKRKERKEKRRAKNGKNLNYLLWVKGMQIIIVFVDED